VNAAPENIAQPDTMNRRGTDPLIISRNRNNQASTRVAHCRGEKTPGNGGNPN
jgi:hypothetical protein